MAFTVEEFRKFLDLIEQHPELREELRRYVLTQELLTLPTEMRDLSRRVDRLEQAVESLTEAVRELVTVVRSHDERLSRVEQQVADLRELIRELAELTRRHDTELQEIRALLARQDERIARLEEIAARQEERLARLEEIAARQEERMARQEERSARLEEIAARQEERLARLEEIAARQEERLARLEEIAARQEERMARQEERLDRHEERLDRIEVEMREMRAAITTLTEAVTALTRKTEEHDHRLDRLSRLYGAEVELRALRRILDLYRAAGWEPVTRPRAVAVNGEFDVVVLMRHPERGEYWFIVEAKARLHPRDVVEFAGKLQRQQIRRALREQGVSGLAMAYLYGYSVDRRVDQAARTLGIGILDELGEAVAPQPVALD